MHSCACVGICMCSPCVRTHAHTHTHTHTGPSLGGMAKARTGAQKPEVEKIMGQHHVFYFADGLSTHTRHAREDKIRSDRHTHFLSLRYAHTHTHTHTHTHKWTGTSLCLPLSANYDLIFLFSLSLFPLFCILQNPRT
jgi:hypothetical protein